MFDAYRGVLKYTINLVVKQKPLSSVINTTEKYETGN